MTSWRASRDFVCEFLTQDTSTTLCACSVNAMLANPGTTPLAPLVQRLLLERSESLQPLWSKARLDGLLLEDVLQK